MTAAPRGTTINAVVISQEKCTEVILRSILNNKGKCGNDFYKYVKRRKGNREYIAAINDGNGFDRKG
jgi:hypothetical protein